MTTEDQIKAIRLVLDNPANIIGETGRDLLETVITNLELSMEETRNELKKLFGEHKGVILVGSMRSGKTDFARVIAEMNAQTNDELIVIDNRENRSQKMGIPILDEPKVLEITRQHLGTMHDSLIVEMDKMDSKFGRLGHNKSRKQRNNPKQFKNHRK